MDVIREKIERKYMKRKLPEFRPGDTVRIHFKIREGGRERIQVFEGVVIARKGGGVNETFTVRKISYGVGVERIFPVHSPLIDKIEVVSRGRVRRAKLYYLRERVGRAARLQRVRADLSGEQIFYEEEVEPQAVPESEDSEVDVKGATGETRSPEEKNDKGSAMSDS